MRTSQYTRLDSRIRAADGDGIVERWHYGGRLLDDPQAMTESGKSLRHGVTERLIEAARRKGINLSEREIQYRIRCARAYPTEGQMRTACSHFDTWSDLRAAGFPRFEAAAGEGPADHRSEDEKRADAARALAEKFGEQGTLFDVRRFGDPEQVQLKDLAAYAGEQHEITERFAEVDRRRREYVERLLAAVDGDESATWRDAHLAAFGTEDVDDRTER